jgi:hypothetical protein
LNKIFNNQNFALRWTLKISFKLHKFFNSSFLSFLERQRIFI